MVKPSSSSSFTSQDALVLFNSLRSAYSATPTALKIIDLYVGFAVSTAIIQVMHRLHFPVVNSIPSNSGNC
ncbi:putative dolichyl-diphosphooligosaccharide--protein glycotransferase [Rosa chinensis]|uniref:Putative dolichyl-diphosphooligosaccharide--protein glycotransferase n=1 Tax=Rosa chinensis TaxID=74649 RepID=A0A2P6PKS3_ROSCH|nr:putative dolichyl-diphosphooligosaccharide--protein glycotransferase [Rosa chinensis]